jgi:pimeloyl-ACP methyl ester carboxylesterase
MHPERSPDYFQRYLEQMRFKGFRRAILSTIRDYLTLDVRANFRSIGNKQLPVFLLWGKLDRAVPFALSKQVLQDIPQSEFHALEDAAHVGFYENPEVVNSMLIEFLNKN